MLSPVTIHQQHLRHDSTANFFIELMMINGVGFEVVWHQHANLPQRWREQFRKRCEAMSFYDDKLRDLCIAEAKLALGLFDE